MKKILKMTLISCIIASTAAMGTIGASASCLSGFNFGSLGNIFNSGSSCQIGGLLNGQSGGTSLLQSILSGNNKLTSNNCVNSNDCANSNNCVNNNDCANSNNCTAGNNCVNGNNCTGSNNCATTSVKKANTAKGSIVTSKAAAFLKTGTAQTIKVSAKNIEDLTVTCSNSCVKAVISSPLENGKATISITGNCKGSATVKICDASNSNVSRNVSVVVGGNVNCNSTDTSDNTNSDNPENNSQNQSYAEEVLKYVNEARTANGLKALVLNETLNKAANIRATEIINYFSHTRPDGRSCFTVFAEVGYTYNSAGENIAYGYSSAKSVVNAWLASPGHRANILSEKFTYMGIGKNGTRWAQLFAG